MASNYQQTIVLNVDKRQLKAAFKELGLVQKRIQKINQTGLQLNRVRSRTRNIRGTGLNLSTNENRQASADLGGRVKRQITALNKANAALNKYVRTLSTADGAQRGFTGSANKMSTQVSALRDRLRGLARSNSEYTSTLAAVQRGEQALFQDRNKRLGDQANRLATGGTQGTKDLVKNLLDENVTQSIAGLNNYASRLNALRDVVNINSTAFDQLSQKIVQVNEALEKTQFKKAKEKVFPQTELGSPQEFKQRQQFAEQRNVIEEQTANITQRINDSKLNAVTKEKLLNDLKRSGLKLEQNQFKVAKQINIETQRNLAAQEKLQARKARITSSTLIGGGFPLLFGGGPLQAAAGALGGNIGERATPGGGFAGSIAATAAISKIQEFVNASREVGNALKDANLGLEKLEQLGYKVDSVTKKQVETLLELGKVREAENLVNKKFAEIIGPQAVKNLQNLDTEFDKLDQQISKLFLRLSADLAPIFTTIIDFTTKLAVLLNALPLKDLLTAINPIVKILNVGDAVKEIKATLDANTVLDFAGAITGFKPLNQPDLNKNVDLSTNLTEGGNGKSNGISTTSKDFSQIELNILNQRIALQKLSGGLLNEEVVNRKRNIILTEASLKFAQAEGHVGKNKIIEAQKLLEINQLDHQVTLAKGKDFAEKVLKPQMELLDKQEKAKFDAGAAISKRINPEIEMINTLEKEVASMQLMNQLQDAETVEQRVQIQIKLRELELGYEITDLHKKDIENLVRKKEQQLENNKAIAQQKALQQEIEGILAGGMTNAVMGLIEGSKTLGQVLADVAKQLASMFLNKAFSSIFGGMFGGGGMSAGGYYSSTTGLGIAGPNFGLAEGGYVNSASLKMIGEGGEPEYVVPASKMDGAMARYSAGARGGSVIPGGSGSSGTVAGGSGNTIVEYTGPTLNFNGDEYVPKSAVPKIINTAAKQGASAGRSQAFSALKNSRSQRASLGL